MQGWTGGKVPLVDLKAYCPTTRREGDTDGAVGWTGREVHTIRAVHLPLLMDYVVCVRAILGKMTTMATAIAIVANCKEETKSVGPFLGIDCKIETKPCLSSLLQRMEEFSRKVEFLE
ncbi:unnamed protein product [Litomosoides sigmodontis]|uniref:Uncharacterized protein n=1 Tax=Litomosoides sigmodontis TaxID=42156 RepID=A0A3P6UNF6_LITSI|nr:unnamed protein product [Litomosoides sigmodontis]